MHSDGRFLCTQPIDGDKLDHHFDMTFFFPWYPVGDIYGCCVAIVCVVLVRHDVCHD